MDQTTRSPKYIAILALASSAILTVGWLARPRELAQSPPPLPSENELAQLARRAERRSLDSMTTYFAVTADDVESSIVRLPALGASGVVWNDDVIVTSPLAQTPADVLPVSLASSEGSVRPAIWGPRLPLAVMSAGGGVSGVRPASRATSSPEPGGWVLAVWRADRERAFAPGTYLQTTSVTCDHTRLEELVSSLALNRMMAGGGLFDIDGNLLAVVLPCGGRFAAIATSSIASILARANSFEQRVLARYGLAIGALAEEEQRYFKVKSGVIVREVWIGHRGDRAGLVPGDIIEAVNGTAIDTPNDLPALAGPPDPKGLALTVRRGAKTLTLAISANATEAADTGPAVPATGLVWESPSDSFAIDAVAPGSPAAAAGIEAGDRLVRIDHAEPRNLAEVQRVLATRTKSPVLLEIERDGRRLAVLLR
ncbi:MAG: PDZ domain-containing protein [Acidobacteriota bacterium]|nr:PDZ domain-containing protein [Acidobacteriota bacterium]